MSSPSTLNGTSLMEITSRFGAFRNYLKDIISHILNVSQLGARLLIFLMGMVVGRLELRG